MLSYFSDKLTHTGYQVVFVWWQHSEISLKLSTVYDTTDTRSKMQNLTDYRVKPPKFCSLRRIIGASKVNKHTHTHTHKKDL